MIITTKKEKDREKKINKVVKEMKNSHLSNIVSLYGEGFIKKALREDLRKEEQLKRLGL